MAFGSDSDFERNLHEKFSFKRFKIDGWTNNRILQNEIMSIAFLDCTRKILFESVSFRPSCYTTRKDEKASLPRA